MASYDHGASKLYTYNGLICRRQLHRGCCAADVVGIVGGQQYPVVIPRRAQLHYPDVTRRLELSLYT